MGWDVDLINDQGQTVEVPLQQEGGIIAIGGSSCASMSVTWNYSKFYYEHVDKEQGFRWLNGKKAKDTIDRLSKAILELGTSQSYMGYWASTKGNAGHILNIMLQWAKLHPEAEWEIS